MVLESLRSFSSNQARAMVWDTLRLTCWPIESHVELDALEDIFKENGREKALKPVLSTILTPGLCAIYSTYTGPEYFRDRTSFDISENSECWDGTSDEIQGLTSIQFHVEEVETDDSESSYVDLFGQHERSRSPALLSPPVANLTLAKEIFPKGSIAIFVSGLEAERQRQEMREFGLEVAPRLAERRASYTKRFIKEERDENTFIQHNIELAVEHKIKQLQMAEELDKEGSSRMERRAKLWRRCANMAEVLAKEEAESFLFRKKFQKAASQVFGSNVKNCTL